MTRAAWVSIYKRCRYDSCSLAVATPSDSLIGCWHNSDSLLGCWHSIQREVILQSPVLLLFLGAVLNTYIVSPLLLWCCRVAAGCFLGWAEQCAWHGEGHLLGRSGCGRGMGRSGKDSNTSPLIGLMLCQALPSMSSTTISAF